MEWPPISTRIRAAAIGAVTAVVASAVSVDGYVVLIFKEPLLGSLPTAIGIGGFGYGIAALFGMLGGIVMLIVDRYPLRGRLVVMMIFGVMAGVLWGDWASGNSPHISKFFAELIAASSWAITAAVAVLVRHAARR